jgi:hypothetical protein
VHKRRSVEAIHRKLKRQCRDSVNIAEHKAGAAMPLRETKQQIEAELNASELDRVRAKFRELIAGWDEFETRLRGEERKVWQPHWSHHDSYTDRFLRIGMNPQLAAEIGDRLAHVGDIFANRQPPAHIQAEIYQINAAGDSALDQLKAVIDARKK